VSALGRESRYQALEGTAVVFDVDVFDIDNHRAVERGESAEVTDHGFDIGLIETSCDCDD
jgi:hypothetical protein